ncbi:MAG: EamA family transporter [Candidatus Coatesbacteria bacterium]|jgi:multidrug transporter EmrE-like cation transporter|nr:EamA family transporter [Candidatus Coatesbacteria bacterium]
MTYLMLALGIVFNAGANILMKVAMTRIGTLEDLGFGSYLKGMLTSAWLWSGLVSFALALACYTYVLSKINLSVAYPVFTSVGFAIVILVSIFMLHETVTWWQVAGFLLIIAGVWLVISRQAA